MWVNPLHPGKMQVGFNHGISNLFLHHICISFCFALLGVGLDWYFHHQIYIYIFFALPALLVSLQKQKLRKRKKKINISDFDKKAEKARIFKCAKSNSFSKTVDRVFLNCWTRAAYWWHILYQRRRNELRDLPSVVLFSFSFKKPRVSLLLCSWCVWWFYQWLKTCSNSWT